MRLFQTIAIMSVSVITLSACATTPDPAKICTADWISKRADKAVTRIESRTQSSIKSLRSASNSWSKGKAPNPFQMFALSRSLKSLEKELKNGQGIKDLKTLSSTCDDPKIVSDALGGYLRKQGLSDNVVQFIEGLDIYQDLIRNSVDDVAPVQS